MSTPLILQSKRAGVDNIKFLEAKKNKYGGLVVPIRFVNNGKDERFVFQTPKMATPFGISKSMVNNEDEVPRWYLDLSFGNPNKAATRYHKIVQGFDARMIDEAVKNCKPWFKRTKMSTEIAEELYTCQLRRYKDPETGEFSGKYADTVRFKLPQNDDGTFRCEIYNENQERVVVESPEKLAELVGAGSQVIAIVSCNSVWFGNGKYGVSWSLVQMQVFPRGGLGSGCAIQPDEDDE